jgi:glutathione S-transferase
MTAVHPALLGLIIVDIHSVLGAEDQAYFRKSREERLGKTLEEVQAGRDQRIDVFRQSLQPLRHLLARQPFLGGESPLFADYIAFGPLQWARVVSPLGLLADDDPVATWFDRCLDLHGGVGRSMPAAA